MRVLVLGAGGQLGSEVARAAARVGVEASSRTHAQTDVTDPRAIGEAMASSRATVVINAAAYTAVDRAESEPQAAFAVNETGAAIVAAACTAANAALVHVSTDFVFDGRLRRPYVESDDPAPLSVYGRSKLAGERAIAVGVKRHLIVRTSWLFGALSGFVPSVVQRARLGQPVRMVADQAGCPTPVEELAPALLRLAGAMSESEVGPRGVLHFAGAPATTRFGFARVILDEWARHAGSPAPPLETAASAEVGMAAARPAWSVLDVSLARTTLGLPIPDWRPRLAALIARLAV